MNSCRYIYLIFILALVGACASTPVEPNRSSLNALSNEQITLLAQQRQLLEMQRNQLAYVQQQNSVMALAIFDLKQEVEELKHREKQRFGTGQSDNDDNAVSQELAARSLKAPKFDQTGKVILGIQEWIWFDLFGRSVSAELDNNLKNSVINANDIEMFERNGDQWVRFSLASAQKEMTEPETFYEAPLIRRVRVRFNNSDDVESRPIIKLKVKLGDLIDDSEFSVVKRPQAEHPVILGVSFMRDIATVDSNYSYTQVKHSENSSL